MPDVAQAQVQHGDSLHADSAAGVRRTPILERIHVILNLANVDAMMLDPFGQEIAVVNSLGAGQDLLATHEHVVAVGEARVVRVRHRVKWSHVKWLRQKLE